MRPLRAISPACVMRAPPGVSMAVASGSATRPAAGWASAALLLGVLPANVQMSVDHGRRARRKDTPQAVGFFAGTLARLPLQWPLVRTALRAARGG